MKNAVAFWQSQTFRLTLTYVAIIMTMSISFSAVIYAISSAHFEEKLLSDAYVDDNGKFVPASRVVKYIETITARSKQQLVFDLIVLNGVMLVFGGAISFALARRTLKPIEENMEAQTNFVSDVSHELRTPLTSMRLTNEIALRQSRLGAKAAKEIISANLTEVVRLQNLSELLLSLLADKKLEMTEKIDVASMIESAVAILQPQAAEKHITIHTTLDSCQVEASVEALTQAVVALIDNAVKYSPPHSVVDVVLSHTSKHCSISVADKGEGIAKEDHERIFMRFYRTDVARTRHAKSGYGLGLPITKKIIDMHAGKITVKSAPGEGSTFVLTIPKVAQKAPKEAK